MFIGCFTGNIYKTQEAVRLFGAKECSVPVDHYPSLKEVAEAQHKCEQCQRTDECKKHPKI